MRRNAICGTSQRHCASLCAYGRLGLAGAATKDFGNNLMKSAQKNLQVPADNTKVHTLRR
jgi:hypothetical protein